LVSMSARPALQSTWRGGGEGWRSFLCNHADRITSIDLFLDQMLRHDVAPLQLLIEAGLRQKNEREYR
jgi:hypothetical protein